MLGQPGCFFLRILPWDSAPLNLTFGEYVFYFSNHSASKSKSMEFSETISTLRIWPTSDYMLKRGPLRQVPWRGLEESWIIQSVVYQGERLSDCQCNLVALVTSVKSTSIFKGKNTWWDFHDKSWKNYLKIFTKWATRSKPLWHYTGWLVGILMAWYNPYITEVV